MKWLWAICEDRIMWPQNQECGSMQLHQRGVDLLVNVMDAADHVEQLNHEDVRRLLKEVADVMGQILERDASIALKNASTNPPPA